MTEYRVDHEPHLSLLSVLHISWTFIFNVRNVDLPRILGKDIFQGRKETTAYHFEKNRAQGLF